MKILALCIILIAAGIIHAQGQIQIGQGGSIQIGNGASSSDPNCKSDGNGNLTCKSVTAGTINSGFYVDGFPSSCTISGTNYTTQVDCAVATLKSNAVNFTHNPTLYFHAGIYSTLLGLQFDATTLNASGEHFAINVVGDTGWTSSVLKYTGTANIASVYSIPDYSTSGSFPTNQPIGIRVSQITIDGGGTANSCLSAYPIDSSIIEDFICQQINPNSTVSWVQIGDPARPAGVIFQGWQNHVKHVVVQSQSNNPPSSWASVTANVSGGSITSFTVNSGGSYVFQNPQVVIVGYGAGRQACTTMPSGFTVTTAANGSKWTVTGVNASSGGSGCSGTIYVDVEDLPAAPYGIQFNDEDSTQNDIVSTVGVTAGIYGGNVLTHPHPYNVPVGIQTGGNSWSITGAECDSMSSHCMDLQGPVTVTGTVFFWNGTYPGASGFSLRYGTQQLILGSYCANNQTAGDFHPILTPNGTFTNGSPVSVLPAQVRISGVADCSGSSANIDVSTMSLVQGAATDFTAPVSVDTSVTANPTGTSTSSANYGSQSILMSTSTWNGSAAQLSNWTMSHQANATVAGLMFDYDNKSAISDNQVLIRNGQAATSSNNYAAPLFGVTGHSWSGSTSSTTGWAWKNIVGSGSNPSNQNCMYLYFGYATLGNPFLCGYYDGTSVYKSVFQNAVQIGASGSLISADYKGSGTLTYSSITAPGCAEQPLTITGAAAGDLCSASTGSSDIGTGYYYGGCRISATNTAQVKVCATATGTPTAVTWTGWARH